MKTSLALCCVSVAMAGCVNLDALDPEGYCRRKAESWTDLMFWKRARNYHVDNATHFVVDAGARVVSWHDPVWALSSGEACERWRRESCPAAPECGRDPY